MGYDPTAVVVSADGCDVCTTIKGMPLLGRNPAPQKVALSMTLPLPDTAGKRF
jgi:hypothetical protein